jgi:hypothetical protein
MSNHGRIVPQHSTLDAFDGLFMIFCID